MFIDKTSNQLRFERIQVILAMVSILNMVVLIFMVISTSILKTNEETVYSSIKQTSVSLALVNRETLAYTTQFAQWQAGNISRRQVQIARSLLSQRLSTFDHENQSAKLTPPPEYFKQLAASDKILLIGKPGFITDSDRLLIKVDSDKFLNTMLSISHSFAVNYRIQLDEFLDQTAKKRLMMDLIKLLLLLSYNILIFILIYISFKIFRVQAREILRKIERDEASMKATEVSLLKSQTAVIELNLEDERKNNFITTINHELRTPLTSIIGYVEILRENINSNTENQNENYLSVIERNSITLLNLVESTLNLSNLESPAAKYVITEVDVQTILTDCIRTLTPQSEASDIAFIVDVQENIETLIYADRAQIFQALTNILSNAIKFSNTHSKVQINISERYDEKSVRFIKICITDSGMGIAESEIPKIFAKFFRSSNAIESGIPGTGLGLPIASQIIDLFQGSLKVDSTLGVGSTFTIELPAHISELQRMINERKYGVLARAISAIESSSNGDLEITCHEVIGALGFYELGFLSDEIALFSDWLKTDEARDDNKISSQKLILLAELKRNLPGINNTGGG